LSTKKFEFRTDFPTFFALTVLCRGEVIHRTLPSTKKMEEALADGALYGGIFERRRH